MSHFETAGLLVLSSSVNRTMLFPTLSVRIYTYARLGKRILLASEVCSNRYEPQKVLVEWVSEL